jgi:hypothetical protein
MAYRTRPNKRLTFVTAFGGALIGFGLVGLFEHSAMDHPVEDTVFIVLGGVAAGIGALFQHRHRRRPSAPM